MKAVVTFLLFILSLPLSAGEAARLHFIGFSEAGNHLAFQQYGITDGEGLAFANTYFIDVNTNKYAANPVETRGEPDVEEEIKERQTENKVVEDKTIEIEKISHNVLPVNTVRQNNLKQAANRLEALKIIEGNQGEHVIAHLMSDVGVKPSTVKFSVGMPLRGGSYETYTLNLEERAGKAECFDIGEPKMLTLHLIHDGVDKTKILQADKIIPKSRGCPLRYRIQDVYLYREEFIAVFLNVFKPGFEGESMRYMVVTGALN